MLPIPKILGLIVMIIALTAASGCITSPNVLSNNSTATPSNPRSISLGDSSNLSQLAQMPQEYNTSTIMIGDVEVSVEIADTAQKQAIGLMGRSNLSENEGMLFVYTSEQNLSFWMKNMVIPIDIVFTASDMKIINIHKSVSPCISDPCEQYRSSKPAKYVVELRSGFCETHGVKSGDAISISGL